MNHALKRNIQHFPLYFEFFLRLVFDSLDHDGSHSIAVEDLMESARRNPDIARLLGVTKEELAGFGIPEAFGLDLPRCITWKVFRDWFVARSGLSLHAARSCC